MSTIQSILNPSDGSVVAERQLAEGKEVDAVLHAAYAAFLEWRTTSLQQRQALCARAVEIFQSNQTVIAQELSMQMGRPIRYAPSEINTFGVRAKYMIDLAPKALADIVADPAQAGFERFIRRDPWGVVLVVAPWNYPLITTVNSVVPALLAGNTVVLKHAAQTMLCAERIVEAFVAAGAPKGLIQFVHTNHDQVARMIQSEIVQYVAFTGSVAGGIAMEKAAVGKFIGIGLELGGCDATYVHSDSNLNHAVETLVDGAFFNSGQSCCGIQRMYVHEKIYADFVEAAKNLTEQYVLGDASDANTTLGPVVHTKAAHDIRAAIAHTSYKGGRGIVNQKLFPRDTGNNAFVAPQIFTQVDNSFSIMREECFGPVCGIMAVKDHMQALTLMNDSSFGLTSSVFTQDIDLARTMGAKLETGVFFMNRCDYIDPALPWTGVKQTGRGASMSQIGFEHLTRPKSYHFKIMA